MSEEMHRIFSVLVCSLSLLSSYIWKTIVMLTTAEMAIIVSSHKCDGLLRDPCELNWVVLQGYLR